MLRTRKLTWPLCVFPDDQPKHVGKVVEGIGLITVSNNTSISKFTPRSKENLHPHEE